MKIELFAVKDTLVGFSQPFGCASEAVALRDFSSSATMHTPNVVNTYPQHKELWKIGIYDDQTGFIENDVKFIAKALDFVDTVDEVTNEEDVLSNS